MLSRGGIGVRLTVHVQALEISLTRLVAVLLLKSIHLGVIRG